MPRPARRIGTKPTRSPSSLRGHRLHRGQDLERLHAHVGQRLVAEQPRQLAHDLAELLRLRVHVAQDRELVQDRRVLRDVEGRGWHGDLRETDGAASRRIVPTRPSRSPRYPRGPQCPTLHGDRPSRDRTRGASSSSNHGRARRSAAARCRPSSSASCATGSRRASTAATSSRPTPAASSSASSATRTGSSPSARRSSRSALLALIEAGGVDRLRPRAGRDRHPRELALGRGPPRPHAPGHLPAVGRQPGAPGLRRRGHAARRADRGPARPRRREGRPDPPHVLRPARGLAAALEAEGLGPDRLLAAEPSLAGRLPGGGRPGVRDDAGRAA